MTVTGMHGDPTTVGPTAAAPPGDQAAPEDADEDGKVTMVDQVGFHRRLWRQTPRPVRQVVVSVIGSTLLLLGLALVVVPGPFTLPLVITGAAVLATEFVWAERVVRTGRARATRLLPAARRLFGRR